MKMNSQKTVGQQLMLASRLYRARMAELLAEISIFPGQELVLQALSGTEGATMKTITRLAAQGLVARRSRTDDARIVLVTLTAEGEAKLSRIGELTSLMEEEIADLLADKDARRLRKLLRRLSKGLAKNPGSTDLDQEGEMSGDDED